MTEQQVKDALEKLEPALCNKAVIQRAIQTAKQIGSSWPTNNINVLYFPHIDPYYRMVIQ